MVSADGAGAAVTSTGASLFWAAAGAPRTSISAADATLRDLILMRRKAVILPALLVAGFIRTHLPLRRARQPAIGEQIAPAQGFTDVGRVNQHQFHSSFRRDVTGSTVLPQLTKVGRGFIRIMRRRQPQHHDLLVGQRPYRPRRRSYDQASRFEYLSLSHQCAGSDDALRTDHCAIQDSRAHTDQRFILHRAAVEDRLMPDRHPRADGQRRAWVRMADRPILEIAFPHPAELACCRPESQRRTKRWHAARGGRRRSGRPKARPRRSGRSTATSPQGNKAASTKANPLWSFRR